MLSAASTVEPASSRAVTHASRPYPAAVSSGVGPLGASVSFASPGCRRSRARSLPASPRPAALCISRTTAAVSLASGMEWQPPIRGWFCGSGGKGSEAAGSRLQGLAERRHAHQRGGAGGKGRQYLWAFASSPLSLFNGAELVILRVPRRTPARLSGAPTAISTRTVLRRQ